MYICIVPLHTIDSMDLLEGFEWDENNQNKNWLGHKVTNDECEDVFYNEPLVIFLDQKHSAQEKRFVAYGITDQKRKLTIIFTMRKNRIRVISARDQSKKERRTYEKTEKSTI